jgi:hypothetical protein
MPKPGWIMRMEGRSVLRAEHRMPHEYPPPSLGATLMPSFQPLLDAVNHPDVAKTYEVLKGECPPGYVWVKPTRADAPQAR